MGKIKSAVFNKSRLISISLAVLFASLLFVSSVPKLSAQRYQDPSPGDSQDIKVVTGGYSIASLHTVTFEGEYYDNIYKSPFTTYFEYRQNDNNFDDTKNNEQTIKIERPKAPRTDVDENGIYYTSQDLKLFSTYYFRAVGYYNDKPEEKYYGEAVSFEINPGFITPYTYNAPIGTDLGGITSYTPPLCALLNSVCDQATAPANTNNGNTSGNGDNNTGNTNANSGNQSSSTSNSGGLFGLVNCGTERYTSADKDANGKSREGEVKNPCGFDDFMKLINVMINYLIKYLAVPLAAIMFAYAGFELVTSGGSTEKKSKAKKIFINVAIGLVLAVGAYVIIEAVLSIAGYDKTWTWFGF